MLDSRPHSTITYPEASVVVGPRRAWTTIGTGRASGYAFRGNDLLGAEALARLLDSTTPEALPTLLRELTGSYGAIKEVPDAVYAAVDHVRSIPLYCVEVEGARVVTDDPLHAVPEVRSRGCDWELQAELLETACVSGAETLRDGVLQVEAGTLLRVPRHVVTPVSTVEWYSFRSGIDASASRDLMPRAAEAHRAAVQRMIRVADGSLIAVPLSGGLDSGILATLLAQSGIDREQVLTFTFGRPGNRESEGSRRVATALGLRWEFVPYSERTWESLVAEPWWAEYLAWGSSLAGVPGFDDLPAVIDLQRRGVLPDRTLVVPGHTLDFASGSQIPGSLLRRRRGSRDDVIAAVLANYYKYRSDRTVAGLLGRSEADVATAIRDRADRALRATPRSMTRGQLVAVADEWGWRERQAKMIVNSVRAYEHQGLRWALPWWDREVIDFWAGVTLRARVGNRLRRDLASFVGWPVATRSQLARAQASLERQARILTLDQAAKKLRNLARSSTTRSRYRNEELACLALFGETRYQASFHGTETPRAMLAEDVLATLGAGAQRE